MCSLFYRKWLWIINFIELFRSYIEVNDCVVIVILVFDCGGSWGGWILFFF